MPREIQMFPEVVLAVDAEIRANHKSLADLLAKYPLRPLESKVAAIAAYCNIAVDGWFTDSDLEKLFELLLTKLKQNSAIIVGEV